MTKYIEINGTRYDLDEEGHAYVGPREFRLWASMIAALGLEIKDDGPSFEDIEPGIYSPHAHTHNVILKKKEDGSWTDAEGHPVSAHTAELLPRWHREGVLYRLNKGEASNA